jgi:HAD superfamily hydrolase (TIGR01509 family)
LPGVAIEYNGPVTLDRSRVRAVCFDVDGTLSDTDDFYAARLSSWLARVPFMREPDTVARRIVMWIESPANGLLGLADTLSIDDEMIAVINWLYRHRPRHRRVLPLVPGITDMLERLHGHYPLAVVSARDERSTLVFLQQHGLVGHFDAIVTALSAQRTKPYPDPIILAAKMLGVEPHACLMVGDTTVDVRAGRTAGAQTVGVLCGFGEQAELRRHGADLILRSTADLLGELLPQA